MKLRKAVLSVVCCFVFPCELNIEGMQNFNCCFTSTRTAAIFIVYEIFVVKKDRIAALSGRWRWCGARLVIKLLMEHGVNSW